jgi:hypothetical protein
MTVQECRSESSRSPPRDNLGPSFLVALALLLGPTPPLSVLSDGIGRCAG